MRERIGEYEVTGRLGQGAMGVVLRGWRARLGVERALKVLASTSPERLQRFEREARALADVQHPNVVAVHEAGEHGGRPWFAMDLVEGEPLDRVLRRGRRSPQAALELARGLARGLAALHALGVVHRDLKPANVVVRPDGSPGILDLGVALSEDSQERLTRTGALVGTLCYMAPEQLTGQRATSACDVYALGAILSRRCAASRWSTRTRRCSRGSAARSRGALLRCTPRGRGRCTGPGMSGAMARASWWRRRCECAASRERRRWGSAPDPE